MLDGNHAVEGLPVYFPKSQNVTSTESLKQLQQIPVVRLERIAESIIKREMARRTKFKIYDSDDEKESNSMSSIIPSTKKKRKLVPSKSKAEERKTVINYKCTYEATPKTVSTANPTYKTKESVLNHMEKQKKQVTKTKLEKPSRKKSRNVNRLMQIFGSPLHDVEYDDVLTLKAEMKTVRKRGRKASQKSEKPNRPKYVENKLYVQREAMFNDEKYNDLMCPNFETATANIVISPSYLVPSNSVQISVPSVKYDYVIVRTQYVEVDKLVYVPHQLSTTDKTETNPKPVKPITNLHNEIIDLTLEDDTEIKTESNDNNDSNLPVGNLNENQNIQIINDSSSHEDSRNNSQSSVTANTVENLENPMPINEEGASSRRNSMANIQNAYTTNRPSSPEITRNPNSVVSGTCNDSSILDVACNVFGEGTEQFNFTIKSKSSRQQECKTENTNTNELQFELVSIERFSKEIYDIVHMAFRYIQGAMNTLMYIRGFGNNSNEFRINFETNLNIGMKQKLNEYNSTILQRIRKLEVYDFDIRQFFCALKADIKMAFQKDLHWYKLSVILYMIIQPNSNQYMGTPFLRIFMKWILLFKPAAQRHTKDINAMIARYTTEEPNSSDRTITSQNNTVPLQQNQRNDLVPLIPSKHSLGMTATQILLVTHQIQQFAKLAQQQKIYFQHLMLKHNPNMYQKCVLQQQMSGTQSKTNPILISILNSNQGVNTILNRDNQSKTVKSPVVSSNQRLTNTTVNNQNAPQHTSVHIGNMESLNSKLQSILNPSQVIGDSSRHSIQRNCDESRRALGTENAQNAIQSQLTQTVTIHHMQNTETALVQIALHKNIQQKGVVSSIMTPASNQKAKSVKQKEVPSSTGHPAATSIGNYEAINVQRDHILSTVVSPLTETVPNQRAQKKGIHVLSTASTSLPNEKTQYVQRKVAYTASPISTPELSQQKQSAKRKCGYTGSVLTRPAPNASAQNVQQKGSYTIPVSTPELNQKVQSAQQKRSYTGSPVRTPITNQRTENIQQQDSNTGSAVNIPVLNQRVLSLQRNDSHMVSPVSSPEPNQRAQSAHQRGNYIISPVTTPTPNERAQNIQKKIAYTVSPVSTSELSQKVKSAQQKRSYTGSPVRTPIPNQGTENIQQQGSNTGSAVNIPVLNQRVLSLQRNDSHMVSPVGSPEPNQRAQSAHQRGTYIISPVTTPTPNEKAQNVQKKIAYTVSPVSTSELSQKVQSAQQKCSYIGSPVNIPILNQLVQSVQQDDSHIVSPVLTPIPNLTSQSSKSQDSYTESPVSIQGTENIQQTANSTRSPANLSASIQKIQSLQQSDNNMMCSTITPIQNQVAQNAQQHKRDMVYGESKILLHQNTQRIQQKDGCKVALVVPIEPAKNTQQENTPIVLRAVTPTSHSEIRNVQLKIPNQKPEKSQPKEVLSHMVSPATTPVSKQNVENSPKNTESKSSQLQSEQQSNSQIIRTSLLTPEYETISPPPHSCNPIKTEAIEVHQNESINMCKCSSLSEFLGVDSEFCASTSIDLGTDYKPSFSLGDVENYEADDEIIQIGDMSEVIDITWMDDNDPAAVEQQNNLLDRIKVEVEEHEFGLELEMEQKPTIVPYSPTDSGFVSPSHSISSPIDSSIAQVTIPQNRQCLCGKQSELICHCGYSSYCSVTCQNADWNNHQKMYDRLENPKK